VKGSLGTFIILRVYSEVLATPGLTRAILNPEDIFKLGIIFRHSEVFTTLKSSPYLSLTISRPSPF